MRFALLDTRPHLRSCAYHLVQAERNCAVRCNYSSCLLRSQKKSFACLTKGNVRTAIETILILPSSADGRRGGSTPRRRRDARQPAAPAAALAQRLRGVVVDGRSDCPAQTSAFSDAAMSWFARARLTSRDRLRGRVRFSGVAALSGSGPRCVLAVRAGL